MTDWFRATSGVYWHADVSRLRTLMMDFVERFTSGSVFYHNFWDHPYGREETGQSFVRKLSRATLHLRVLQRRYRNRHWKRVQTYLMRGLNQFGDEKRGLLYYTLHFPRSLKPND